MSKAVKLLIGLAAALLAGWAQHGPAGTGQAFIGSLEGQARAAVEKAEVPNVGVSFPRAPLSRTAVFTGPADDFQRNGMGEMPGLNGVVAAIPGVEKVRWTDDSAAKDAMPLLAEVLLAALGVYLIGLGIGWFLFGRPKRESYL